MQAITWANQEPGRSDYDAAKVFGLSNQSGLSIYRKKYGIKNPWRDNCPTCGFDISSLNDGLCGYPRQPQEKTTMPLGASDFSDGLGAFCDDEEDDFDPYCDCGALHDDDEEMSNRCKCCGKSLR